MPAGNSGKELLRRAFPSSGEDGAVARPRRSGLEIRVLGALRVERGGTPVPGLNCDRARELLAYLLIHRQRAHRREALAERLWGGAAGEPRRTLRQALWHLHAALGPAAPLVAPLAGGWLRVDSTVGLWLDLSDFEACWSELESESDRWPAAESCSRLQQTLALYRGELLEGSGWEWCLAERARVRDLFLALADRAMAWCVHSKPAAAVRLGYEILRHEAAHERTHQDLMRLHALSGDRAGALRQFERCEAALRTELGVEPSRATRELLARIRSDQPGVELFTELPAPAGRDLHLPATEILDRLRQLRALLSAARSEVHVEIQAIESALAPPATVSSR